ncbi:MAG: lipid-binding SYLF domain-containing protein [Pseudomonadota bacterium]
MTAQRFFPAIVSTLCILLGVVSVSPAQAQNRQEKAEALVRDATETLVYFTNTPEFSGLWENAVDAKAMVIVPASYRAGFLFGGSGGKGVMVARNADGSWSGPTFLSIGSVSFGLQAGGEVSEVVLLAMTERGKEGLLASSMKLGGDVTIAAGPVGLGAPAQTVDILAFARTRGLYGGISLEGSILDTKKRWNRAYYGADVSALDVVFRGVEDNPASIPLREAALALSSRSNRSRAISQAVGQSGSQRPPLPDPATLTPPAGRIYTAPGQTQQQGEIVSGSSVYGAPGQPSRTGPAPATNGTIPVLRGGSSVAPRYEDDPAYEDASGGAPLKRP